MAIKISTVLRLSLHSPTYLRTYKSYVENKTISDLKYDYMKFYVRGRIDDGYISSNVYNTFASGMYDSLLVRELYLCLC